jgi:predicted nucleotide-binding protein
MKPRVFVGSSVESLKIAEAILYNLEYTAQVTPWSQGIFKLSKSALNSLTTELKNFDFGIFVLSPDDILQIRNEQFSVARDNVIFELGLFIGKLGAERCFIVVPRDCEDLHLPTDLTGFTPATYDAKRDDNNWKAALSFACIEIKESIERLGRFETSQSLNEKPQNVNQTNKYPIQAINTKINSIIDQQIEPVNNFV